MQDRETIAPGLATSLVSREDFEDHDEDARVQHAVVLYFKVLDEYDRLFEERRRQRPPSGGATARIV